MRQSRAITLRGRTCEVSKGQKMEHKQPTKHCAHVIKLKESQKGDRERARTRGPAHNDDNTAKIERDNIRSVSDTLFIAKGRQQFEPFINTGSAHLSSGREDE